MPTKAVKVDYPNTAALAGAGMSPADFPTTTAAANDFASIRIPGEPSTKRSTLPFTPDGIRFALENRRFDNGEHGPKYVNDGFCSNPSKPFYVIKGTQYLIIGD